MFSEGIPRPIQVIACLPPLLYETLLFIATGMPRTWWLIVSVVLLMASGLFAALDYPLGVAWPALAGLFLLSTCLLAVIWDIPQESPIPFTHTELELELGALLACVYVVWGIVAARRVMRYI